MCAGSLPGWGARGGQAGEAEYGMRVSRWSPSGLQNGSGGRLQHSERYVCSFSGGSCSFADVWGANMCSRSGSPGLSSTCLLDLRIPIRRWTLRCECASASASFV